MGGWKGYSTKKQQQDRLKDLEADLDDYNLKKKRKLDYVPQSALKRQTPRPNINKINGEDRNRDDAKFKPRDPLMRTLQNALNEVEEQMTKLKNAGDTTSPKYKDLMEEYKELQRELQKRK